MSIEDVIGLVIVVAVLGYLGYAVICPERLG